MYKYLEYVQAIVNLSEKRFRVQAGSPLDKKRTESYIKNVRHYLDLLEQEL